MNRRLTDQFQLRLPSGMRERIKAAADANDRSMNAEIVAALEEKYPAPLNLIQEALLLVERRDRDDLPAEEWDRLPYELKCAVIRMEIMISKHSEDAGIMTNGHLVDAEEKGRVSSIFEEGEDANPYPDWDDRRIAWSEGYSANENLKTLIDRLEKRSKK